MATRKTVHRNITRIKGDTREKVRDVLATEAAVTVFVNKSEIVTLLCSPTSFVHLAVGFLFSEGMVKSADDVREVKFDAKGGVVNVELMGDLTVEAEVFEHRALTTGCGRGTMFYTLQDQAGLEKIQSDLRVTAKCIHKLTRGLQARSEQFNATGAVHSAAIADVDGILFVGEDVGRHNAVDKIVGRALMERVPFHDKILLTSGRISSEILVKTARAGFPIIASRAAPTHLAVRFADSLGITLVGFVRGKRMNIYTHEKRIST